MCYLGSGLLILFSLISSLSLPLILRIEVSWSGKPQPLPQPQYLLKVQTEGPTLLGIYLYFMHLKHICPLYSTMSLLRALYAHLPLLRVALGTLSGEVPSLITPGNITVPWHHGTCTWRLFHGMPYFIVIAS